MSEGVELLLLVSTSSLQRRFDGLKSRSAYLEGLIGSLVIEESLAAMVRERFLLGISLRGTAFRVICMQMSVEAMAIREREDRGCKHCRRLQLWWSLASRRG
jgi:hypothetical protein